MPFTPYHLGPSGFVGLLLRKWIDLPVFVLANVVVDIEVLFFNKWPIHRHFHTLLIGAVAGAIWAAAAYPLRAVFGKLMNFLRLPYKSTPLKMIVSGILGAWLHVAIDAVYHYDVLLFWPNRARPLFNILTQSQVKFVCIGFFVAAAAVYLVGRIRQTRANNSPAKPLNRTQ